MTRLKIVSDGTPMGTKVMTQSGEVIENVTSIYWNIRADGTGSHADISITPFPIEVTPTSMDADVDINDICKHFDSVTVNGSGKHMTWKVKGIEEEK